MTALTKWQQTKSNIQLLSVWLLVSSIPLYGWYVPLVGETVSKLLMAAAFIFMVVVAVLCGDESEKAFNKKLGKIANVKPEEEKPSDRKG